MTFALGFEKYFGFASLKKNSVLHHDLKIVGWWLMLEKDFIGTF